MKIRHTLGILLLLCPALRSQAAVFTVINSNDAGSGSLRQAILDSNGTTGPNVIEIAIPGSPAQVIKPQAQFLPPLKGPVVLRLKTANSSVILDGSNLVKPRTPADCPGETANYNFETNRWEYSDARGTGPNVRGYYGAGLAIQDSHDVEIIGVEIRNFCIGIAAVRSNNVYIHNVKVVDSHGAAGVIFTGDDGHSGSTSLSFNNRLVDSVLLDNGDGFEFTRGTHDSLLQGNTISLTQALPEDGNAVEFASSGDNNAVIDNTFSKYVDIAITVGGNNHTILNNKIVQNKCSGMRGSGNNLLIAGNTIAENGASGLIVTGAGSTVVENVVTANAGPGVVVGGPRITISRNTIYNNDHLGIDAGSGGRGAAPPGRGRGAGPPQSTARGPAPVLEPPALPNPPTLDESSKWNSTGVFLNGSLISTPTQAYNVEIFASRSADHHSGDEKGWGEGEKYLGTVSTTTDSSGKATFTFSTKLEDVFGKDQTSGFFTATVTDRAGSTSKFSRALSITRER